MTQTLRPQPLHYAHFLTKPAPPPERWSPRQTLVFVILVNSALWAVGGCLFGMAVS